MAIFKTKVNRNSEGYQRNYQLMQEIIAELDAKYKEALFQGEPKYIERTKKTGRLLARERIELVLDPDSPFMELLPLAGWGTEGFGPGGTIVAGIGFVSGRLTMINSNVGTIKGGAIELTAETEPMTVSKVAAMCQIEA